ncbi:MAG: right-handed parallel beta-helix repeat-containing protein [Deltaproteobacteria bacterium]|nr:right-handed parallel beta-helix repeat-containing protein [Deltaproteobacteria bacterium]
MRAKRKSMFNTARYFVVVCITILGLLTIIGTGGGGGGGSEGGGGNGDGGNGDTTICTASGSYALVADTLTIHFTSSNFADDEGPQVGVEEYTVTSIGATAMEWVGEDDTDDMIWTRDSGTVGDITGTWEYVDEKSGWTYELTINSDGTFTVTGIQSGTPVTLVSIAVTPANPGIFVGFTQQFTAIGTYSNSSTNNISAEVAWSSSNTSVATIDGNDGNAAALAEGTTTITATLGDVSGSTTLTVTSGGIYTGGTIRISSNDEFTAANGVVSGSGTQSDPYIIEGWTIDASSCDTSVWPYIKVGIAVGNTSKYFEIKNCSVSNADTYGCGISLTLLSNGTVRDCTLANDYTGISIDGCSNVVIENNTVENCYIGISNGTYASNGITISDNTVTNCTNTGIKFHYLTDSFADSNTVTNNGTGIYVSSVVSDTPNGCTVTYNTVQENSYDGIDVNDSQNVRIANNGTNNNGGEGIGVWCSSNIIAYNTSNNNGYSGIRLDYVGLTDKTASNNVVADNNAMNNGMHGLYIGLNCVNNDIHNNLLLNNNALDKYYADMTPWYFDIDIEAQPNTLFNNDYGTSYIAP